MTVFLCTCGGALLGMCLRTALPPHHLDAEPRDVVKVGIGLIATMTALVLGLVLASAKSSFDAVELESTISPSVTRITRLPFFLAKLAVASAVRSLWARSGSGSLIHQDIKCL